MREPNKYNKPKQFYVMQTITRILTLIAFAFAITMSGFIFSGKEMPYFFKHFGLGITLMLVGGIAILLPRLNKYDITSTDKGDKFISIVGILLVLIGAGTIIYTFL